MSKETASADLRQLTKALVESTQLSWINAATVCAQIEGEFPGKTREILERAAQMTDDFQFKDGILMALVVVIENERLKVYKKS